MPAVSFVFTNPRHHVEMMVPVARELRRRGVTVQLVSLAELRGFATPPIDLPTRRAIPFEIRRKRDLSSSTKPPQPKASFARRLAQRTVALGLVPRVRWLVRGSRVVVVPNDSVFPYVELIRAVRGRSRTVLMQEGIRFDSPDGDRYASGGTNAVCAWGAGSAELFLRRGAPEASIAITGAPRLDTLEPPAWHDRGAEMLARLGLRRRPVAFLSNPIENQGFGTAADKLALFTRFLVEAAPVLDERDVDLVVKNHLHEDPTAFAVAARGTPAAARVHVLPEVPLFAALAASCAGVVLTSTVGLEALMFGLPIAALEVPGHGFAFEYVSRGAALGLREGQIAAGLRALLEPDPERAQLGSALVERHLHDRGRATANVADVIQRLL